MIELRKVSKRFLDNVVLDGVDFIVRRGETVALLGPSGVGKSVLLKHIIGLIKPDSGEVFVDGLAVPTLGRKELSELRSRIGYVFQNGALFDSMNVFENVRLGITDESKYSDLEYCQKRIAECIRLVNLPADTIEKYPAQLSGGMRKRVGIARAIAGSPKYLLYDEPTSGLDPVTARAFDRLLHFLAHELGLTIFIVTHDLDTLLGIVDRAIVLAGGTVIADGTVKDVMRVDHPWLRSYFANHGT